MTKLTRWPPDEEDIDVWSMCVRALGGVGSGVSSRRVGVSDPGDLTTDGGLYAFFKKDVNFIQELWRDNVSKSAPDLLESREYPVILVKGFKIKLGTFGIKFSWISQVSALDTRAERLMGMVAASSLPRLFMKFDELFRFEAGVLKPNADLALQGVA